MTEEPTPLRDTPPGTPQPPSSDGRKKSGGGEKPNPTALIGAGMELGGVVAVLAFGGWWLDKYFGTSPWLVLSGTAVGIIGGVYNLWRLGKRYF